MAIKVTYLTGSRADFGLMRLALQSLDADPRFDLEILVTGQHLHARYGNTIDDVRASKIKLSTLAPVPMAGRDGQEMAAGVALQMQYMATYLSANRPDILMLLGDRGEMLVGALAALYLGIPVAHFHGGERSGTVDDAMRRAISAMSHFHFPATILAERNLRRMGELEQHIFLTGAPGLDGITDNLDPAGTRARLGLGNDTGTKGLVVFHPVVQDAALAGNQAKTLLMTLAQTKASYCVLASNSDAGGHAISSAYAQVRKMLAQMDTPATFHWFDHFERTDYLSVLASSDVLIGNSSSGIIEAASLGVPVVNIGDRQAGRERNNSVFDCDVNTQDISDALQAALAYQGDFENLYFQGGCSSRLPDILTKLNLGPDVLKKAFDY